MVSLRAVLVVCAITAAQSTPANGRQQTLSALRAACSEDAQRLCAGVPAGGGRIVACLKEHKDQLSDKCRQAAGLPPLSAGSSPAKGDATASPASGSSIYGAPSGGMASTASGAGASASATPAGTPAASSGSASSAAGAAANAPITVAGEKFVPRIIADPQHEGMRAATILVPEKWHFESKLEWHYEWVEYPVSMSSHAENPENAEAYFEYPFQRLESTEVAQQFKQYDKSRSLPPGSRLPTGALSAPPQPPVQALALFVKKVRPNVPNLKWVGQQDLPDLPKALHLNALPNPHGVAIKVSYDLNGQPVEEAFFGVYYISQGANAGVNAGMIKQTNWGFQALQSFRAPAGTLDKRMPMFCVIAKSVYVNPEWARLSKSITDKMVADFNQKLQQGYDQIKAAHALMEQTMQQEKQFQATFDKQEEMLRSSPGADDSFLRDGGARSASDHFDDLIRGVDTVNDPSTGGTIQLTNQGQYHFTDGFGNYISTDDPNYTPEKGGAVGSWTQMTAVP